MEYVRTPSGGLDPDSVERNFQEIADRARAAGNTGWLDPVLAHSWVSYGVNDTPGYRIRDGILECRGAIKNGTMAAGQLVMTLNVTLVQRSLQPVLVNGGVAPELLGGLMFNTDGTVLQNWAFPANNLVSLASIRVPVF